MLLGQPGQLVVEKVNGRNTFPFTIVNIARNHDKIDPFRNRGVDDPTQGGKSGVINLPPQLTRHLGQSLEGTGKV